MVAAEGVNKDEEDVGTVRLGRRGERDRSPGDQVVLAVLRREAAKIRGDLQSHLPAGVTGKIGVEIEPARLRLSRSPRGIEDLPGLAVPDNQPDLQRFNRLPGRGKDLSSGVQARSLVGNGATPAPGARRREDDRPALMIDLQVGGLGRAGEREAIRGLSRRGNREILGPDERAQHEANRLMPAAGNQEERRQRRGALRPGHSPPWNR